MEGQGRYNFFPPSWDILLFLHGNQASRRDTQLCDTSTSLVIGQNVDGNKLFVHNVNAETSKDRLKKAFGKHGRVMDAVNSGKNFAFITYSCPEEVQAAISAMNGTVVCGRKILCEAAKPDREGRGGRGGGNFHTY